jgi:hypothetical protein
MKTFTCACLFPGLFALASAAEFLADPGSNAVLAKGKVDPKAKQPRGKITISKETTFATGPVGKDGYVDYTAALNMHWRFGVTAANNANVLIWQAFGPFPEGGTKGMRAEFFQWMAIKSPPKKGPYYISLFPFVKEHLYHIIFRRIDVQEGVNDLINQLDQAQVGPWKPKDYPELASWLRINDRPLARIVEASRRPEYFSPLVPTRSEQGSLGLISALLPAVQKCRDAATALIARAMLRLGQGKTDAAWQDLLACHRLGRLVGRGSTLIEALVGIAINAIASKAEVVYLDCARPNGKRLQRCLEDLRKLPPLPSIADKVDSGERYMFLDVIMLIDQQGANYLKILAGLLGSSDIPNPLADYFLQDIDWDPALRNGNRWYDRQVAALRQKTRTAREKKLQEIDRELKALKQKLAAGGSLGAVLRGRKKTGNTRGKVLGDVLISLLMPRVRKVQSAVDRAQQIHDNLLTAIALARYERAHQRYPKRLEALVPKYLGQVPQDIFSGKPLVYRPTKRGYLLNSVGPNGEDLSVRMPGQGK